ncbi:uncharacterized protein LOC108959249 [Eucalyptus grandis]|uniref:uncharacterized protein LOC108959249 n=1 Tax=Eucalyptus grandis TaxID=71139 RepID=UPI00192EFC24|nr:uncharacterized protein LOC108959249 [Eucalyptus grandis]
MSGNAISMVVEAKLAIRTGVLGSEFFLSEKAPIKPFTTIVVATLRQPCRCLLFTKLAALECCFATFLLKNKFHHQTCRPQTSQILKFHYDLLLHALACAATPRIYTPYIRKILHCIIDIIGMSASASRPWFLYIGPVLKDTGFGVTSLVIPVRLLRILVKLRINLSFNEASHTLERDLGVYFGWSNFEELMLDGQWNEAEKYLSGFTELRTTDSPSMSVSDLRKENILTAMIAGRQNDFFTSDLTVFQPNKDLLEEMTQFLTSDNIRRNNNLAM